MKKLLPLSRVLLFISSAIIVTVYFVPFWQILMWAPQYPEGLNMKIWINNITGDVEIINGLNHYIGMKHIEVEMFPEFKIMPILIGVIIGFGLLATFIGKKSLLWSFFILIVMTGIVGLVDFYRWGYDYGHNLDPKAAISVPGMSYQPPLIGTKVLLNFTAYSGPDIGGWVVVIAGLLTGVAIGIELYKNRSPKRI
jgi:copper chaperone NosL